MTTPEKVDNPNAVALGKLGGSVRSVRKNQAIKKNLAAARAKRWFKKPAIAKLPNFA